MHPLLQHMKNTLTDTELDHLQNLANQRAVELKSDVSGADIFYQRIRVVVSPCRECQSCIEVSHEGECSLEREVQCYTYADKYEHSVCRKPHTEIQYRGFALTKKCFDGDTIIEKGVIRVTSNEPTNLSTKYFLSIFNKMGKVGEEK